MTYEEWEKTYQPIRNWKDDRPFESRMFETFGDELDFVDSCNILRVWTVVDTDEGERIIEGMRFVNRIGYLVTVRPWSEPTEVTL